MYRSSHEAMIGRRVRQRCCRSCSSGSCLMQLWFRSLWDVVRGAFQRHKQCCVHGEVRAPPNISVPVALISAKIPAGCLICCSFMQVTLDSDSTSLLSPASPLSAELVYVPHLPNPRLLSFFSILVPCCVLPCCMSVCFCAGCCLCQH